MYKYINKMGFNTPEDLYAHLRKIKHIALDMDGTIYNGSTLFPFTIPFLHKLKEMGIGYSFLTNNPSKSTDDYLAHLSRMGISAQKEEIYTSAQATIGYIKENYPQAKRLFILGTPSMIAEFEAAGFISIADDAADIPDMLVVGFDMSLTYSGLCRAAWWASRDIPYIATNPDKVCPTDKDIILVDCGSIYTAIEHATGRKPDVVIGKPDPRMLDGILLRYSLQPREVAMIGDRIYTDVRMAHNAGAIGVLVMSGETTMDIVAQSDLNPDIIAQDLAEFQKMLEKAFSNSSLDD
ncbi:HAD-IIA family hydrolase [Dysgonomonas sp. 511]|uniref:HAD-IIA family hydrolase n=1 Tax=Dysgonomonas sp. 511 TaxID=2302930 RepID=UPI0013D46601|nr:HAD-IIA family hydrolase [Dysgonomonas sp. 511]NDV78276.1 HAD-IIA family hydrolase [Dysgonomonas sp. 511]